MKHEEILSLKLVRIKNGSVLATTNEGKSFTLAFTEQSVNPELFNLLRAAPMLYETLAANVKFFEELERIVESVGVYQLSPALLAAASGCKIAMMVAVEGLEEVDGRVNKNKKAS